MPSEKLSHTSPGFPLNMLKQKASAQHWMHYQTVRFSRHVASSQSVYAAECRPHLQPNDFWELLSYPSCSETTAINLSVIKNWFT